MSSTFAPRGAAFVPLSLALVLLASGLACTWDARHRTEEVRFRLPAQALARAVLGDLPWLVAWREAGGRPRQALVRGSSFSLDLEAGRAQSILAWPLGPGGRFRPAGLRYPDGLAQAWSLESWFSGPGREAELTWLDGWVAELAQDLEAQGLVPEAFNLGRLRAELEKRFLAQPGAFDPWHLDPGRAAGLLAKGGFRVDLLDQPETFPQVLPGPGPWCPETSFGSPGVEALAGGGTYYLPTGTWRFFGPESALLVAVDEDGRGTWVRLPNLGPEGKGD